MKNTNKEYAIALYDTTHELKGKELEQALENFVQLLFRSQKLRQAANIITEFEKLVEKKEGKVRIKITSARELDTSTINHIKKLFGDKVESTEKVDASILGGVIVRDENTIFDASLKTQLIKLKQSLT